MGKKAAITLICIGSFFLLLANVALWARWNLFSPTRFSALSVRLLQEENVRLVLAGTIVEQALKDRPLLLKAAREPMTGALSGLLNTSLFTRFYKKTSETLFRALTRDHSEGIYVNIEPARKYLAALSGVFKGRLDLDIPLENWPSEIEIIAPGQLPPLYKVPPLLNWIGLLALLVSAGAFIWTFTKSRNRIAISHWTGITLMTFSLVFLIFLFPLRPLTILQMPGEMGQTLVGALYDGLVRPLMVQTGILFFLGLALFFYGRSRDRLMKRL